MSKRKPCVPYERFLENIPMTNEAKGKKQEKK
jgi:hypothetical protein